MKRISKICIVAIIPSLSYALIQPTLEITRINTNINQAQSQLIESRLQKNEYKQTLQHINSALEKNPNNVILLQKKAGIYIDTEDYLAAKTILNDAELIEPNNQETKRLRMIAEKYGTFIPTNEIGYNYDEAYVSDLETFWDFSSLHYYRYAESITLGARVNYAHRFGTTGEQYQLEAYPQFKDSNLEYIKLQFAYANFTQILFPNYQYYIEPYFKLPKSFELSVGQSGLSSLGTHIYTFTSSLASYVGNNYIWLRPYHYTPKSSNFFELGIRHYFEKENSYINFKVGAGKAPDILDLAPFNNVAVLNQKLVSLNGQFSVSKQLYLQLGLGYLKQIFPSHKTREITDGNAGLIWKF